MLLLYSHFLPLCLTSVLLQSGAEVTCCETVPSFLSFHLHRCCPPSRSLSLISLVLYKPLAVVSLVSRTFCVAHALQLRSGNV